MLPRQNARSIQVLTQVPPVLLSPALPSFSSVRSSSSVNSRPIPQPMSGPAPAISSLASWAAHMVLSHPPPPQQPSQRPFNVQRRAAGAARPSLAPAVAIREPNVLRLEPAVEATGAEAILNIVRCLDRRSPQVSAVACWPPSAISTTRQGSPGAVCRAIAPG